MKESFGILFLTFLANINEHFPESNDYNRNTFLDYNINIKIGESDDISSYLNLDRLYNDYGINYNDELQIFDMKNIYPLTNISEFKNKTLEDSFILLNNKKLFEKVINELINNDLYTIGNCIVLIVEENILNNLSSEEVQKYKKVNNCFIITYSNNNIYDKLYEIRNNTLKIKEIKLDIRIDYTKYSTSAYIIFICLIFFAINALLFLFMKNYLKINNQNKLGIHFLIIICFFLLNILCIFIFIEILLSKNSLIYKLIPKGYFIIKIIKTIFFCIIKNMIMWIFFLINRAYCILFFDKDYKNKYIKIIIFITLCDYILQILFKFDYNMFFEIIYIKDLYNIIYYIVVGIYIFYRGKNISLGLRVLLYVIEHDNIRVRTQEELNNIKEVINRKIMLRQKSFFFCYLFCTIGIISPFLYLLFSSFKGSTIYDIIIFIQFIIILGLISKLFYPQKLLQNYTITYEQLINGIPEKFLNEYLYSIDKEDYIKKEDFSKIEPKHYPIIIINPFQILINGIYDKYSIKKLNKKDKKQGSINKDIVIKMINSCAEKGQIGYWNDSD